MELFYIILSVVIVAAIAGVAVWGKQVVNLTIFASLAAASVLVVLPVYPLWTSIAKHSDETYVEFWNGSEISVEVSDMECFRDGSCSQTYQCDPYTVFETETYLDSEGNMKTRTVSKTKWHDCPYSQVETTYRIDTTLGSYHAGTFMTGEEFRVGVPIPGGRVMEAPVVWVEAKERIDSGVPGGVTKMSEYKNYILSSDETLFKEYSDLIDDLLGEGLLVPPASNVYELYQADKVYNIGVDDVDTGKFAADVSSLNAAVGGLLHGDLHVVFVDSARVGNSTDYANALQAYWTSDAVGKNAIAKNTITVIVGVKKFVPLVLTETIPPNTPNADDVSEGNNVLPEEPVIPAGAPVVDWVESFTGMPLGNESLITQLKSELKNVVIGENFIGSSVFKDDDYTIIPGNVSDILFGKNKFMRVSMDSFDENDHGSGFKYLSDAWKPDEGTMVGIYVLSSILALISLFGAFMVALNAPVNRKADPLGYFIHHN